MIATLITFFFGIATYVSFANGDTGAGWVGVVIIVIAWWLHSVAV